MHCVRVTLDGQCYFIVHARSLPRRRVHPPQDQGHGKQLLRTIYKAAQADTSVLDVNVEAPTEVFSRLREGVELEMLKEHDKVHVRPRPPASSPPLPAATSLPREACTACA